MSEERNPVITLQELRIPEREKHLLKELIIEVDRSLHDLTLATKEKNLIADLAVQVEIEHRKQFRVTKQSIEIFRLVNFALDSTNPAVMRALRNFVQVMQSDTASFLKVLGVDMERLASRNHATIKGHRPKTLIAGVHKSMFNRQVKN